MKKKGFTLIELLAVIVILSVIALIATPMILNVVEESKKSAYKDSVLSAFDAVEYYVVENKLGDIPENGIEVKNLNLKNNNFKSGKIIKNAEGILGAEFVSDGEYCASGTLTNLNIDKGECEIDLPEIEVIVTSKTAVITIVDTYGIIGYAITENSEEPIEWTNVEETSRLTEEITATHASTYYVHVKNKYGKISTKKYVIDESAFNYEAILSTTTYTATVNTSTYAASSGESCSSCRISSVSNYGSCLTASGASGTDSNYHTGTCPDGRQKKNSICGYGISVGDYFYYDCKTTYSCPNGGLLSGTTCTITTYTCPDGGTLNGTTCTKEEYTCPDGGILNETICER